VLLGCTVSVGPAPAATPAVVLSPGQVDETAGQGVSQATAPSDGRLRGQDFTAMVTDVAWPQSVPSTSGITYVAGSGHRLVAFTVSVTQPTDDSGLLNAPTAVTAALQGGSARAPVSMTRISQQIAGGPSGSAETTGTDSFVASVPARAHSADLVLTEAGFSQSFDLWTLTRLPPSPSVLYRDPSSSTVTGMAAASFNLAFTNPADGFSSSDDAQLSSATLTYFAPDGSGTTPGNPSQAFLVVGIQSSYPNVPYGQPNSGHFFSSFTPLPGNRLTFTPTGGSALKGTSSTTAFSSTNAASDDDGIFDTLYWFSVPATTTAGTLTVTPGPATGTEYTGFTGTGNAVPIDVTAPATVSLNFPAGPSSLPAQKKPPWVGAPLPPTGTSAASSTTGSSSGRGPGLPIGVAVGILALLAAAVTVVQRVRHRSPATAQAAAEPTTGVTDSDLESSEARSQLPGPVVAPAVVPTEEGSNELVPTVNVMGPLEIFGLLQRSDRRIVEELLVYLVLHDRRHLRVGQIQIGLRPVGSKRPEISAKTLRNYLYELRRCVGPDHLPEASAREGYLIQDVACDWVTFQRLDRQADVAGSTAAIVLRTEALALVRGKPFEGLPEGAYEWVDEEGLIGQITVAIATCALKLATDHLDAKDYDAATGAARAGHRGAPYDYGLWEIGARALDAKGDRAALKRWMAEAATKLDAEDIARIWDSLGHRPDSERS